MKRILFSITTIVFIGSLFAQATAGLIGNFKFEGNVTNSGSANITATAIGTTYIANKAGVSNNAIQFNGTTASYVDFVDNGNLDFSGTTNFSIAFSFYFNGTSTGGLIDNCLNYGGWGVWFWQATAGIWNIQFHYKNASVGSSATTGFSLGSWYHVAAVRNNGVLSVYIDGVFRLSGAEGGVAPSYPLNMIAGAFAYSGYTPPRYNSLNGRMDELLIYNRALSSAEVLSLSNIALPLTLTDFTGRLQNNNAILNWKTENEQNTSHFEVERSTNGRNYTAIGNVTAMNQSGIHNYSYTDNNIAALVVPVDYYRLKQIDIDGKFTYSKIIALSIDNSRNVVLLYPNPAFNELNLSVSITKADKVQGRVIDNAGRVVKQQQWNLSAGSTAITIDVNALAKGMYYLELKGENINERKQFVKQ